ncbi:MAG: FMN-binding glutamate synthase family protein [Acidobacteria bacterium]|nr:FMN-binding glutamate synthase family protein [Acidobacteriota bacterium]
MLIILTVLGILLVIAVYDLTQREHAILRNFPLIGHLRYLLEAVGPELRQYIVTDNDEERPFSRDQRTWVYASAKRQNNLFGFGTDNDLELSPNYLIIKQSSFPRPVPHPGGDNYDENWPLACAKVLGGARNRPKAFRPQSVVNISAMSYGSLSSAAVEALNRGAAQCGCMHNTGEGGVSPYHRSGGDLVWQLGTGYFGARAKDGTFSIEAFRETLAKSPTVRAIEVKLSQGAKPGHGGILPGAKVTPEIAAIRGVPVGQTVESPPSHSAFGSADELLDFVEMIAQDCGLPVGIKSAVGQDQLWHELAALMRDGSRGVDFISIDGGEGGTGAAPLVFADHVALPFKRGMAAVYPIFEEAGVAESVVWIGSGKLGFPARALFAFGLGCDMVSVAREAMLAIGCIQAQRCHTGHCPTGVATQKPWLVRGLDPMSKSARLANYVVTLRKEIAELVAACGCDHPGEIELEHFAILDDALGQQNAREVFGYSQPGLSSRS